MTTVDRLIDLIEREDLKPAHIVKELGISNSSFTDWKKGKGKPSLEVLIKFAKRFDVSLDYLVFGKEETPTIKFTDPEEQILISKFRQIPSENKASVMAYLDGILAVSEPDERKKVSS